MSSKFESVPPPERAPAPPRALPTFAEVLGTAANVYPVGNKDWCVRLRWVFGSLGIAEPSVMLGTKKTILDVLLGAVALCLLGEADSDISLEEAALAAVRVLVPKLERARNILPLAIAASLRPVDVLNERCNGCAASERLYVMQGPRVAVREVVYCAACWQLEAERFEEACA